MFNSKFNNILTVLLVVAIIGILVLIGYFGFSVYNKYRLNAEAKKAVDAFEEISSTQKNEIPREEVEDREALGTLSTEAPSQTTGSQGNKTKYGGYEVYGTISIPKIKIEYPILEKPTPQAIKIAVAYLSGVRNQ